METNNQIKLEFVEEWEMKKSNVRNESLKPFLLALQEHPNRWAKFPEQILSASAVHEWKKSYPQFRFRVSGGNNLPKSNPDKRAWILYVKYTPNKEDRND